MHRCLFVFSCNIKQNQDRKHRTYVYVLTVTETLEAWEDSVNIGTAFLLVQHTQHGFYLCGGLSAEWRLNGEYSDNR